MRRDKASPRLSTGPLLSLSENVGKCRQDSIFLRKRATLRCYSLPSGIALGGAERYPSPDLSERKETNQGARSLALRDLPGRGISGGVFERAKNGVRVATDRGGVLPDITSREHTTREVLKSTFLYGGEESRTYLSGVGDLLKRHTGRFTQTDEVGALARRESPGGGSQDTLSLLICRPFTGSYRPSLSHMQSPLRQGSCFRRGWKNGLSSPTLGWTAPQVWIVRAATRSYVTGLVFLVRSIS